MLLISLLFLPSALFAIPYGIQYNSMSEDRLASGQCSLCFDAPYEKATYSEDILSCAGPVLFVGVKKAISGLWYAIYHNWDDEFLIGAFGLASEVQRFTVLNKPHESNGVYWYFTPGKSFGFLGDDTLEQATADIGDTNPDSRLSWNLSKYGGYRVGRDLRLGESERYGLYRKRIYNCPLSI